ncbi:MAG: T9SS type A sorting domain-containing protein, partial [Flavobacteriales bacterium]
LVNNTFDIALHNPDARIKAMEFTLGGIFIQGVTALYNTSSTPILPQYSVGGNRIIMMATNDSSFIKYNQPTAILRVSFASFGDPICINEIVHIVNSHYEATNTNNLSACVSSLDNVEVVDNELLSVWPNPGNDELTIDLKMQSNSTGIIVFSNALGETVKTVQLNGTAQQKIDCSTMPSGIYFLRYPVNGKVLLKKVIIQH